MGKLAKLTFLGTGTSQGVPMIGCDCPVCMSTDPRDKRYRSSAFVEYCGLSILIDCGPDFRSQMIRHNIRHIDAILLTHNHKDHTGGLDDIRAYNLIERHPVNIYCEDYVITSLKREYAYAFGNEKYPGSPEWRVHSIDSSKPFIIHSNANDEVLEWIIGKGYAHYPSGTPAQRVTMYSSVEGSDPKASAEIIPIRGYHLSSKDISVLGYRFGNIAYLTDIKHIEDEDFEKLKGLDYITLGCVKRSEHRSHPSLEQCLDFFNKVGAKESYITHISHLLPSYNDFAAELPKNVHPAYDGLVLE